MIIVTSMVYLCLRGRLDKTTFLAGILFGAIELFGEIGAISIIAGK